MIRILALSFLSALASAEAAAPRPALEAARELVGVYTGHWVQYDPNGNVVLEWDDRIEAVNPRLENGRAVVTAIDQMRFTYPRPFTVNEVFTEGYAVNPADGSAGVRFFEYDNGMRLEEREVAPGTWTIEAPVDLSAFRELGITNDNVIYATHLSVKTTTFAGGREIQRVTLTTTLVWKDGGGQVRTRQFVGLTGTHERPWPSPAAE